MAPKKSQKSDLILATLVFLAIIAVVAITGFLVLEKDQEIIHGQVEVTEYRVSGKVPGRILEFKVEEGQKVKQGDTLVILEAPEVNAKLEQAQAAMKMAQAQNRKALKGVRFEKKQAAYELWKKAKVGVSITEKSYNRIKKLYEEGVMTAQKFDEITAKRDAAKATERAAKLQYEMAKNGAEAEDKLTTKALINKAEGAINEVNSYLKEMHLTAAKDGEISEISPQIGELVGTGAPIMNVAMMQDMWITFNVREDMLSDFKVGDEIVGTVPGLKNKEVTLQVYMMKDLGSYATWKATKTNGDFDFKTFEVKAKLTQPIKELRPGMSVIVIK